MPIIVGAERSGTTLLRMMLDAHPELAIPPETHFLPTLAELSAQDDEYSREQALEAMTNSPFWPGMAISEDELRSEFERIEPFDPGAAARAFYRSYASRFDKRRWGDKTPSYGLAMGQLQGLLPEAHFVHIIRDGRDAALSMQQTWFGLRTAADLASDWRLWVGRARSHAPRLDHYIEVRYEELVREPRPQLERVCEFVDLPFDAAMLDYHRGASRRLEELESRRPSVFAPSSKEELLLPARRAATPPDPARIGRWRVQMPAVERREFERVAGDLLAELGYEVGPMSGWARLLAPLDAVLSKSMLFARRARRRARRFRARAS
jgi:hypothetical protein